MKPEAGHTPASVARPLDILKGAGKKTGIYSLFIKIFTNFAPCYINASRGAQMSCPRNGLTSAQTIHGKTTIIITAI